jgi:hypothetical protein
MKEVIELQKIKAEIKKLQAREDELKGEILVWMKKPEHKGATKIQTPYGNISLSARKKFRYTGDVDMMAEQLKMEKVLQEKVAVSREQWIELGRPSDVPVYEVTEFLTVTEAKQNKEENIIKA